MGHVDGSLSNQTARELFDAILSPTANDRRRVWVVCRCDADEYIGHACLQLTDNGKSGELLFYLLGDYWNRGYATELASRLVRYAFEDAQLEFVTATVDPEHTASRRVLEKAGLSIQRWEQDDLGRFPMYSIQGKEALG